MACNCASKEQLDKLYATYGDKRKVKELSVKSKIKYYLQYTGVAIAMIFIWPILLLYVIYKSWFDLEDKKISLRKFFNIKTTVDLNVEQQNI